MGQIVRNGQVYSGSVSSAAAIHYDNTQSGLSSTSVQAAIDELKENGGGGTADPGVELTYDEWLALPEDERNTGTYYITDGIADGVTKLSASKVAYGDSDVGSELQSLSSNLTELETTVSEMGNCTLLATFNSSHPSLTEITVDDLSKYKFITMIMTRNAVCCTLPIEVFKNHGMYLVFLSPSDPANYNDTSTMVYVNDTSVKYVHTTKGWGIGTTYVYGVK